MANQEHEKEQERFEFERHKYYVTILGAYSLILVALVMAFYLGINWLSLQEKVYLHMVRTKIRVPSSKPAKQSPVRPPANITNEQVRTPSADTPKATNTPQVAPLTRQLLAAPFRPNPQRQLLTAPKRPKPPNRLTLLRRFLPQSRVLPKSQLILLRLSPPKKTHKNRLIRQASFLRQ